MDGWIGCGVFRSRQAHRKARLARFEVAPPLVALCLSDLVDLTFDLDLDQELGLTGLDLI